MKCEDYNLFVSLPWLRDRFYLYCGWNLPLKCDF